MGCPAAEGPAMNAPAGPAPLLQVQGVTLQYRTEKHLVTATYRVSFDLTSSIQYCAAGLTSLLSISVASVNAAISAL